VIPVLRRLISGARALVWRKKLDQELSDELRQYVDAAVEERRKAGFCETEAHRLAKLDVGSVASVRDGVRDLGWEAGAEAVWQDFRYAARALRKVPSFATAAILTLALAIGLNVAIFSLADAVLLRPLPFPDSDRLVWLASTVPPGSKAELPTRHVRDISVADLLELRARARTLASMGVYANEFVTLTRRDGSAVRLEGSRVEPQAFQALGAVPLAGRIFTPEDAAPGAQAVALLSYETWRREFGGDKAIVGAQCLLDGQPRLVIGIMTPTFQFPFEFADQQFWRPLTLDTATEDERRIRLPMLARLAEGASPESAARETTSILRSLHDDSASYGFVRVRDEIAGPVGTALGVLVVAVGFVLLIACANVANLLLARGAAKRRELAIRSALGAGRGRLIRQLLAESLLLASLGATGGVGLAFSGIRTLRTLATTLTRMDVGQFSRFPRLDEVRIDGSAVAYTVVAAIVVGLLCGLVPALRASRADQLDFVRDRATTPGFVSGLK
jgi:predicted permease